ncbi:MAG: hypothetical protein WC988_01505 [Patescibacteria group bacterium]
MLSELRQKAEWVVQNDVKEYWELGGKLNEQSFNTAMSLLSKLTAEENPLTVKKSSLAQAKNVSESSKVAITHEQELLYAALREMTKETGEILGSLPETQGTAPWNLTDQPLLAEVLLLTGETAKYDDIQTFFQKQSSGSIIVTSGEPAGENR